MTEDREACGCPCNCCRVLSPHASERVATGGIIYAVGDGPIVLADMLAKDVLLAERTRERDELKARDMECCQQEGSAHKVWKARAEAAERALQNESALFIQENRLKQAREIDLAKAVELLRIHQTCHAHGATDAFLASLEKKP